MELMIGVLLTHGNLAIAANSNLYGYPIDHERVTMMSYLPLAHIYEVCFFADNCSRLSLSMFGHAGSELFN